VADEARGILDNQDAMTELEGLRNLATYDQLSLRLKQAEEFFAVLNPFATEHPPSGQVTDMDRHIEIISQFRLQLIHPVPRSTGNDVEQSGIEQLQRSGYDPIGQIQEYPVAVLKPLGKVASLALGDLVDRAELFLYGSKQVLALTPSAQAEEVCQTYCQRYDRAEAIPDQAGIGRIVNVGSGNERVAPDRLSGLGYQPMPLGHDQVVDPLNRIG